MALLLEAMEDAKGVWINVRARDLVICARDDYRIGHGP
jgi:hypothetical protein